RLPERLGPRRVEVRVGTARISAPGRRIRPPRTREGHTPRHDEAVARGGDAARTRGHARGDRDARHRGADRVPSSVRSLQQGHRTGHPPPRRGRRRLPDLPRLDRHPHREPRVQPRPHRLLQARGRVLLPAAARGLLPRKHWVRFLGLETGGSRGVRRHSDKGVVERPSGHARRRGHDRAGAGERGGDLREPRTGAGSLRSLQRAHPVLSAPR
ncbi:hypothetical protein ACHAWF_018224, partial [Thalassiosira exigua]